MSTTTLMTVEEFAEMQTEDTESYELVDGELIPLPSGTAIHADIRGTTEYLLRNYFDRNPIGRALSEMDCRLTEHTVRKPDVSVVLGDRLKQINRRKGPLPFAPDIAVEVLSPSESAMNSNRKVLDYLAAGSREVWLMDYASGELFVRTNSGMRILHAGDVLESPLLPGFSAAVADLLAGF